MNGPEPTPADGAIGTEAPPTPSPGALLKMARERAGHGVEDLAAQLKLSRSTLEALERDDFASLSEPVYVRGYYRKVARVLGVPENEVLEAYSALQPSAAPAMRRPETPLPGGVDAGMARRGRGAGLLVTGMVVVVSVVLLVLLTNPQRPKPLVRKAPAAATQAPAEPDSAAGEASSSEAPAETPEPQAPAPADTAPAAEAPAAAPEPQQAPARPAAAIPEVAANAGPRQLVLQFTESSFVRIEDARGRTLLIGLVRANESPVLDGEPPYGVFLGNAGNVRVFHGGKPIDFSSAINPQNQTARFTVP